MIGGGGSGGGRGVDGGDGVCVCVWGGGVFDGVPKSRFNVVTMLRNSGIPPDVIWLSGSSSYRESGN